MKKEIRPIVLITNQVVHHKAVDLLKEIADVKIIQASSPEDIVIEEVREVDAILARTVKITKKVIQAAPRLKIISRHGVGVDGIDVEEATKKGIFVTITPEANAEAVSEYTIALMLAFSRKILKGFATIKERRWDRNQLIQNELSQKVLGIIGLGNIGIRVARKAKAFNMRILGFDPYISPEKVKDLELDLIDFDSILKESDIISLHVPATSQTKGMIGKRELDLMKNTALLVNTARGDVIDETALFNVLQNQRIAGACLDTFCQEPLSLDNKLPLLDNVILTPHIAAQTEETLKRVGIEAANNIIRALSGEIPSGIYNKKILNHLI